MRMDPSSGETALELIERLDDDELADVIYQVRRGAPLAARRALHQAGAREQGELATTLDLRRAVVRAVGPGALGGVDPATRTFQALRIAVNRELERARGAARRSRPTWSRRAACVADHLVPLARGSAGEARVPRSRRSGSRSRRSRSSPSDEETTENPRARSAKLRAARARRRARDATRVDEDGRSRSRLNAKQRPSSCSGRSRSSRRWPRSSCTSRCAGARSSSATSSAAPAPSRRACAR